MIPLKSAKTIITRILPHCRPLLPRLAPKSIDNKKYNLRLLTTYFTVFVKKHFQRRLKLNRFTVSKPTHYDYTGVHGHAWVWFRWKAEYTGTNDAVYLYINKIRSSDLQILNSVLPRSSLLANSFQVSSPFSFLVNGTPVLQHLSPQNLNVPSICCV